jgi:hypothetical protein
MREGIGSPGWARTSDFLINREVGRILESPLFMRVFTSTLI